MEKVMSIKDFADTYFTSNVEDRHIEDWVPVLEKFIYGFIRNYYNIDTRDDLYQICWIACLKAIKVFDITKGICFTTFLGRCMRNELLMYYRKIQKHTKVISLENAISEDTDGHTLELQEILGSTELENDLIANRLESTINEYINNQVGRDKDILIRYILKEETQKTIAASIGMSQSYVSRIIKKHINKIKQLYSNSY